MKKYMITLLALSAFVAGGARTFTVGGIDFRSLDAGGAACEVVHSDTYEGDVVVPSAVTFEGVSYTVEAVGDYAFAECGELLSVSLPSTVERIGRNAFQSCPLLREMVFPDGVAEIRAQTFYGCGSLASFSGPGVESIGASAFSGCSSLTDISFGSLTYIGDSSFRNCVSLTEFVIPDGARLGINVFAGCTSLESVTLPAGLDLLPDHSFSGCTGLRDVRNTEGLVEIGDHAFDACSSLVDIPFGPCLARIGVNAFGMCSSLSVSVIEGDGLVIDDYAFAGCSSLQDVELMGVVEIGVEAFANCSALSILKFDASLHRIRERTFRGSDAIAEITCCALQPPFMANNSFMDIVYQNATLIVPEGKDMLYRQSPPWSYFLKVVESGNANLGVSQALKGGMSATYASGRLTLQGDAGSLEVFDGRGVVMFRGSKGDGSLTLDLGEPGLYLVRFGRHTMKILCR